MQLWLEARWTLLRETSARTGKSQQGLLFLVKRLVRLKHGESFAQSVVRKMNDSTVFPFKNVINYSWPGPFIFKEQLFGSERAKL